jgi:hypothetical protein
MCKDPKRSEKTGNDTGAAPIPIIAISASVGAWRCSKHFPLTCLPASRPQELFLALYKWHIIGLAAFCTIAALLIVGLLIQRSRHGLAQQ